MTETLPRRLLSTDAGRAAVAQAWVDGATQKRLAKVFGYKASVTVNLVISSLVRKYYPDHPPYYDDFGGDLFAGDRRKSLAKIAVQRYLASREQAPA